MANYKTLGCSLVDWLALEDSQETSEEEKQLIDKFYS